MPVVMLRHATYRQERPFVAFMGDVLVELRRPTRVLMLVCVLIAAVKVGVPVDRVVPPVAKEAYGDARGWQQHNAAKLACHAGHSAAKKTGSAYKVAAAEQRCTDLERRYGR